MVLVCSKIINLEYKIYLLTNCRIIFFYKTGKEKNILIKIQIINTIIKVQFLSVACKIDMKMSIVKQKARKIINLTIIAETCICLR